MTTPATRLQEIQERLDAVEDFGVKIDHESHSGPDLSGLFSEWGEEWRPLMENAPYDLKYLLAELTALRAELEQVKVWLAESRDVKPCEICAWPQPIDNEHYICECCGFQAGYDDPKAYQWNGKWWSKAKKGCKPKILEQAEAALREAQQERDRETELRRHAEAALVTLREQIEDLLGELRGHDYNRAIRDVLALFPDERPTPPEER